jgi:energy-coupling factor transport system ATP-binding protein
MALIEIENFNFTYPKQTAKALSDINIKIDEGAFAVICGRSGSGKTTILRQLKPEIAPFGIKSGKILYNGKPLEQTDARTTASEIGFVMQNPDNQIVTDKVWHELAFGLESLGFPTNVIRLRVAETANFFGIQNWFLKKVTELSGGQKQVLNLASIMAMQPKVLILDEPTSQLDPIAAENFLEMVKRINRELAVTVILTEHRLEEVYSSADLVAFMEDGRLIKTGTPEEMAFEYSKSYGGSTAFDNLPTPVRIFALSGGKGRCPMTVRDGRNWLSANFCPNSGAEAGSPPVTHEKSEMAAVEMRDVWFRYGKDMPDVLRGVTFKAYAGEIYCILGGNGSGKSTTLSTISRIYKPLRGAVKIFGRKAWDYSSRDYYNGLVGMLPQDPQALFVKDTVREDLMEMAKDTSRGDAEQRVNAQASKLELGSLMERHPFDLSGGEQQKAAFAKVLLKSPKIILLDEPTKGIDAHFKIKFGNILKGLSRQGAAVIMATHDVEFAARFADRCALFFNGEIVCENDPVSFFSGNSFYTTAANRMARNVFPKAITAEDVISLCARASNQSGGK